MPYLVQPQPNRLDAFGEDLLKQAILALMTKGISSLGQVPAQPTATHPGTFNFPPGSQSPGEASQIARMGGVPTTGGFLARATQMPGTGGMGYQPPTQLGFQPDLTRQSQQADIDYKRSQTTANTPEFLANTLRLYAGQGATPGGAGTGGTPPPAGNEFLTGLSALAQQADTGNEDAVKRIRMIRQLMQAP